MQPMTKKEVSALENLLLYQSDLNDLTAGESSIDVLEWGSGGSTVHYPKFLRENDIAFTWTSIEYNREWYKRVKKATSHESQVKVVLFDVENTRLKQRRASMGDYVEYPSTLGTKWDFILIDGRKRRRCLIVASKLLVPHGITVLHDAQREYYHCAFEHFKHGEFLVSKLWAGRQFIPPVDGEGIEV